MFKKLLSNLPFNPGLFDQLSFYGQRLRKEAGIRRLGFVMMALAMVVQLVAALYPAQNSLAASPNNVLDGITNKNSILKALDNNVGGVREIYEKFGIERANIYAIPGQNPNATVSSGSGDMWSVGKLPLSTFGINGTKWGERSIKLSHRTIYQRPLRAWDSAGPSYYPAFHGKNKFGVDFWILQTCGNPTFHGPYLPKPPPPKLEVHKTLLTNQNVKPGDTVKFRLEFRNKVKDSLATNFRLVDNLNNNFQFVSLDGLTSRSGNQLKIARSGELGYSNNPYVSTLVVKVRNSVNDNAIICNQATVRSDQDWAISEKPCVQVNIPTPKGYCVASAKLKTGSKNQFIVRTQAFVKNGAKITGYSYDLGPDGKVDYHDQTSETPHDKTFSNLGVGLHTVAVTVQLKGLGNITSQTPACIAQMNVPEKPRVILTKTVTNLTSHQNNANGTTVKPGDVLEFKMKTENVTNSDYLNYQGEDYFGSVLQYADLTDQSQLANQGMTLGSDKFLRWTSPNIKANSSEVKVIRVKVKSVIPSTNSPSRVSPDFNCKITNDYGNEVTLNVNCPFVKQIGETNLPNTGPGPTVVVASVSTAVAGYLFMRTRIMANEVEIIRNEYVTSGGL